MTEISGRYQVSLNNVGFPDSHLLETVTRICDFELTDDRLMFCALRPLAAVDGVVGDWRGNTSYRDEADELHDVYASGNSFEFGTLPGAIGMYPSERVGG